MPMTTVQLIQQEMTMLPEWALEEVLDFVRFLQTKTKREGPEVLNAASEALLREAEAELERGDVVSFSSAQEAIAFLKSSAATDTL